MGFALSHNENGTVSCAVNASQCPRGTIAMSSAFPSGAMPSGHYCVSRNLTFPKGTVLAIRGRRRQGLVHAPAVRVSINGHAGNSVLALMYARVVVGGGGHLAARHVLFGHAQALVTVNAGGSASATDSVFEGATAEYALQVGGTAATATVSLRPTRCALPHT